MKKDDKTHDLYDFMQQLTVDMESEYNRIQKRAVEDPGTAGDQGEENWATLLRGWLPTTYEVVTRGRIIGYDGNVSPQIDVLVLSSSYPNKLKDKKMFLAGGVIAAFECKTTLKALHLKQAVETCKFVKSLYPSRSGTPYKELQAPVIYGLLAHSHTWKAQNSESLTNIENKIIAEELESAKAPNELLDLICVADLATWLCIKSISLGTNIAEINSELGDGVMTTMLCHSGAPSDGVRERPFTPIGAMIGGLFKKLAVEDSTARSMASYYDSVGMLNNGSGKIRIWPKSVFSESTRKSILGGGLKLSKIDYNEWNQTLW